MKTPLDIPDAEGQRVRSRGRTREGIIDWMRGKWVGMKWDDGYGPDICHVNELQKIENHVADQR